MEFIIDWTNCIISVTVLFTIVELIIPDGKQKKTILMITGIMTTIAIATPVINLFNQDFEMADVFSDIVDLDSEVDMSYDEILERQVKNLEKEYSDKILNSFNERYPEMPINECKVFFIKDAYGKITDIERVEVVTEIDNSSMKYRLSEVAEISKEKIVILVMPKEEV